MEVTPVTLGDNKAETPVEEAELSRSEPVEAAPADVEKIAELAEPLVANEPEASETDEKPVINAPNTADAAQSADIEHNSAVNEHNSAVNDPNSAVNEPNSADNEPTASNEPPSEVSNPAIEFNDARRSPHQTPDVKSPSDEDDYDPSAAYEPTEPNNESESDGYDPVAEDTYKPVVEDKEVEDSYIPVVAEEKEVDYEPEIKKEVDDSKPGVDSYDPEAEDKEVDDDYTPAVADNDDYNPEALEPKKPKTNSILRGISPVGLPPKPPVNATEVPSVSAVTASPPSVQNPHTLLTEAYETIMQSDLVKDPNFVKLPKEEQMKLIMDQLNKNHVNLTAPALTSTAKPFSVGNNPAFPNYNYDQVYSYNKPFKNLKNPIPLVPVNEFCRRPNLTAPMTPEEERDYDEFIKRETYYMNLQNWDEFPDKLRLFIGNLPANTVSKQDLFRIFNQYGEVIQIAIKAGYGFTQFRTAEACLDCIKGETNVPLHNKIMRLDASKPQKSRRPGRPDVNNPNLSSNKRENEYDDGGASKKHRSFTPDCQVYISGKSSVFFIRKVKKAFASAMISIDVEDVTHKPINEVISEAAYSGVLGCCVIKELKVDVQTFESTPDGGVKFDEYSDVEPEIAAEILLKAKSKKYNGNIPPPTYDQQQQFSSQDSYNDNGYDRRGGGSRNDYNRGGGRGYNDRGGRGNQWNSNNQWGSGGQQQYQGNNRYGGRHQQRQQQPYGSSQNPYGSHQGGGYGSSQPQPYGSQQNYGQQPYGQAPPPPQQSYGGGPSASVDPNLIQTLQNMDANSMQQMISLLQQQQQQPPQQTQPYGGYPQSYGSAPSPPMAQSNTPTNQVNALLSQLQSSQGSGYNQNSSSQQQPGNTQSLMETLARLSRK